MCASRDKAALLKSKTTQVHSTRVTLPTIPMPYPGSAISKNHLYNGGDTKAGMNRTAKRWKRTLAEAVTYSLMEAAAPYKGALRIGPPVHIEVGGSFVNPQNAPDMHNLTQLIADAVQLGSGINDRHFTVETRLPTFGALAPTIYITVQFTVQMPG